MLDSQFGIYIYYIYIPKDVVGAVLAVVRYAESISCAWCAFPVCVYIVCACLRCVCMFALYPHDSVGVWGAPLPMSNVRRA